MKVQSWRLGVAGNQSSTADTVDALVAAGHRVDVVLNVGPDQSAPIAGYHDLAPVARGVGARLVRPATYSMTDEETRRRMNEVALDLLVVVGWQRLLPAWFLDRLPRGAYGVHGSSEPLPKGRGRSPMNWTLLEGRDRFYAHLIRYDAGVDSGPVVATTLLDVHPRETIRSLSHKVVTATSQMLLANLAGLASGTVRGAPQPSDEEPTYYPARVPDDGVLDWTDRAERVDRMVRAVTKPYPGAFTWDGESRILVWAGWPNGKGLRFPGSEPGEVLAAYADGTFLVQAGDAPFYVTEWDSPAGWSPRLGRRFRSVPNPSWSKLAAMGRHVR